MKQIVVFLIAVLGFSFQAHAQRKAGGVALQAKYGIMKGEGEIIKDYATTGSLGVQMYLGEKGYFFDTNLLFQDFYVDYEQANQKMPYQLYGLNVMGGWSFENLAPFYLNIKAGGFAGYYVANKGINKEDTYGTTFVNPVKGVTFGIVASAEAEIVIWNKLAGVVSFSQYYYPSDKWIRSQYAIEAGFKWYF